MEYTIAIENDPSQLEQAVSLLIADGWAPLGGVCAASGAFTSREGDVESEWHYFQAMTKEPQCPST